MLGSLIAATVGGDVKPRDFHVKPLPDEPEPEDLVEQLEQVFGKIQRPAASTAEGKL